MYSTVKLILQRLGATALFFIAYLTFRFDFTNGIGYGGYPAFPEFTLLFRIIFGVASFFTVCVCARFFLPVYDKKNRKFRDYKIETVVVSVLALFGIASCLLGNFPDFGFGMTVSLTYLIPTVLLLNLMFVKHRGNIVQKEEFQKFFSVNSRGFRAALPTEYYREKPPKHPLNSVKIGMQAVVYTVQAVYPIVISIVAIIETTKTVTHGCIVTPRLDLLTAILITAVNAELSAASIAMAIKLFGNLKNEYRFGTAQTPELCNRLYALLLLISCLFDQLMINAVAIGFTAVVFLETFASFVFFNLSVGIDHPKDVVSEETFLRYFGKSRQNSARE